MSSKSSRPKASQKSKKKSKESTSAVKVKEHKGSQTPEKNSKADKMPLLNVVLFNVHSSDLNVGEQYRSESLEYILCKVKDKFRDGPLFVLCQDEITKRKHNILRRKLGHGERQSREAAVYFRPSKHYTIGYVDVTEARNKKEFVGSDVRLSALVLTPSESQTKILLVSWHGPYNVDGNEKERIFKKLVKYLDRLKLRESCDAVLVGGDFNLSDEKAQTCLNEMRSIDGEVVAGYTKTTDRKHLDRIDYIVCWPRDKFCTPGGKVMCRRYRREPWTKDTFNARRAERRCVKKTDLVGRPFEHPIVAYSIKVKQKGRREAAIRPSGTSAAADTAGLERDFQKMKI